MSVPKIFPTVRPDYLTMPNTVARTRANVIIRHDVDTAIPRAAVLLDTNGFRFHILVQTGAWFLTFVFLDGSSINITSAETAAGAIFDWEFAAVYISNMGAPAPAPVDSFLVYKHGV